MAGVNQGLESLRARPWPYLLLRAHPEPWRAEDSLLVVYAMYYDLQDASARQERLRAQAARVLADSARLRHVHRETDAFHAARALARADRDAVAAAREASRNAEPDARAAADDERNWGHPGRVELQGAFHNPEPTDWRPELRGSLTDADEAHPK